MPGLEAAEIGDVFVTLTGNIAVIRREHFERMQDGAIVCNSGHFNVEIEIDELEKMATKKKRVRKDVDQYTLSNGKRINILGEGRLINLASAEGHPASVMDMSFANQALSAAYMVRNAATLKPDVYDVPVDIDREIARIKLEAMGVKIDALTEEQFKYLNSWEEGT